ncbi:MAG: UbiA family prenyltransferase [Patescibacteria group bacterium]
MIKINKIKELLYWLWNEFIYGGHFQSLGAASIAIVSAMIFGVKITWDCFLTSYLMFYPLYLYNRCKEINIDYLTNPERTNHIKKYIQIIPTVLFLDLFFLAFLLIFFGNQTSLIFAFGLIVLGILYTTIFKKLTKKIVIFKNLYVALFFSSMVFFPVIYYEYEITPVIFIFALFTYLKALTMQVLLDVKDIETDNQEKLLTFPVIFGKEKTLKILNTTNIIIIIIMVAVNYCLNIFPRAITSFILIIPFHFYCIELIKKNNYFGYILVGGEFILWLLLFFITKTIIT